MSSLFIGHTFNYYVTVIFFNFSKLYSTGKNVQNNIITRVVTIIIIIQGTITHDLSLRFRVSKAAITVNL